MWYVSVLKHCGRIRLGNFLIVSLLVRHVPVNSTGLHVNDYVGVIMLSVEVMKNGKQKRRLMKAISSSIFF